MIDKKYMLIIENILRAKEGGTFCLILGHYVIYNIISKIWGYQKC